MNMGKNAGTVIAIVSICLAGAFGAQGGLLDSAEQAWKNFSVPGGDASPLSSGEIADGLVEALRVGAEKAVERASSPGGFLQNQDIRIPLPPALRSAGDLLRKFGMAGTVDAVEETMNTAAEKASAEAMPVLLDALKGLSFEDAQHIWKGGDTAATDYFREKTWAGLYEKFRPVVHESAGAVGVTAAYQKMTQQPMVKNLVENTGLDLDHYVTEGALSGLFVLLGQEEQKIRTDPLARTSDLLKKVFGN